MLAPKASLIAVGAFTIAVLLAPAVTSNHPINPLQPGDDLTIGSSGCTANFVFDGAGGQVYLGTAGHCGSLGNSVDSQNYANFGTIVYDNDGAADFALIQVTSSVAPHVSAAVRGHAGTPTGVIAPTSVGFGDVIDLSGFGVGFSVSPVLRENRFGPVLYNDAQVYCADAPAIFGDSGGPVIHRSTGKALGIVNGIDAVWCQTTLYGTMLTYAISEATAAGFPITLRTA